MATTVKGRDVGGLAQFMLDHPWVAKILNRRRIAAPGAVRLSCGAEPAARLGLRHFALFVSQHGHRGSAPGLCVSQGAPPRSHGQSRLVARAGWVCSALLGRANSNTEPPNHEPRNSDPCCWPLTNPGVSSRSSPGNMSPTAPSRSLDFLRRGVSHRTARIRIRKEYRAAPER